MTALLLSHLVLWVLVIALSLVVFALVRQIGVLHERISPVGALMLRQGLQVGELAPAIEVPTLDGTPLSIGGARTDDKSTLIVFVSPTCPICKVLLPVLKSSRSAESDWLDIVLASDGDDSQQRQFVLSNDLRAFPYVLSTALGLAFQVGRLPFAAVIDGRGILRARGLVNSREHLESLFEAKRRGVASLQEYFEVQHEHRAA